MRLRILLIAFSLTTAIILTNLLALIFTDNTYKKFYQSDKQIYYVLNVVNFIRVDKKLDSTYFSTQAMVHMQDVKVLITGAKLINVFAQFILFSLILYNILKMQYAQLKRGIILGIITTTLLVLFTFILALINFNYSFVLFHKIFFKENNWLFVPDDNLVKLFPIDFFTFFIGKLTTNILITVLLLLVAVKFIPHDNAKHN